MTGLSLFVCSRCNSVDEMGVAGYDPHHWPTDPAEQLCTECRTGRWHGLFPKDYYNPQQDMVINRATGLGLG